MKRIRTNTSSTRKVFLFQTSRPSYSKARPSSATSGSVKVRLTERESSINNWLDLTPAPPVGFNLTFICNTGKVFSHDWFAAPFIMMTCQVSVAPHSLHSLLTPVAGRGFR